MQEKERHSSPPEPTSSDSQGRLFGITSNAARSEVRLINLAEKYEDNSLLLILVLVLMEILILMAVCTILVVRTLEMGDHAGYD